VVSASGERDIAVDVRKGVFGDAELQSAASQSTSGLFCIFDVKRFSHAVIVAASRW
jgi:hypothetical protein